MPYRFCTKRIKGNKNKRKTILEENKDNFRKKINPYNLGKKKSKELLKKEIWSWKKKKD